MLTLSLARNQGTWYIYRERGDDPRHAVLYRVAAGPRVTSKHPDMKLQLSNLATWLCCISKQIN